MPIARNNSIGLTMYGGAIRMGKLNNDTIDVSNNFKAVAAYSLGKMSKEELVQVEKCACPTLGACMCSYNRIKYLTSRSWNVYS
jgi:dihydroxy-acid dehydratase